MQVEALAKHPRVVREEEVMENQMEHDARPLKREGKYANFRAHMGSTRSTSDKNSCQHFLNSFQSFKLENISKFQKLFGSFVKNPEAFLSKLHKISKLSIGESFFKTSTKN